LRPLQVDFSLVLRRPIETTRLIGLIETTRLWPTLLHVVNSLLEVAPSLGE
jgi:hypothetical protein